jgi:hypothetical protein
VPCGDLGIVLWSRDLLPFGSELAACAVGRFPSFVTFGDYSSMTTCYANFDIQLRPEAGIVNFANR